MPDDPKKPVEIVPGRVGYAPDYKSIDLPGPRSPAEVFRSPPKFEVGLASGGPSPDDDDEYRRSRDLAVAAQERARIVAWMRSYTHNKHAQEWATAIEKHEDKQPR